VAFELDNDNRKRMDRAQSLDIFFLLEKKASIDEIKSLN
jgi:hypothetical protein